MTRRRRTEAVPASEERRARVAVVRLPAREIVSVQSKHAVWQSKQVEGFDFGTPLTGAIVRVQAPADAGDDMPERVRLELEKRGAFVRMLPRAAGAAVVARDAVPADNRTAREVAMAMVDEASTNDREGLRAIVTWALDAEGV